VLPALTNGSYFTQTNGQGTDLQAGASLNASQTMYVYAETGTTPNCTNENQFTITINQTPTVDSPIDVSSCDSYVLTALTNGSYYTQTNGQGTNYQAGATLNTTQTVYIFAETGTTPNCTNENQFVITINPLPIADFEFNQEEITMLNPSIELHNTSFGNIINRWNLGDGSITSETNPTHDYTQPGPYTIELEVENEFGCISSTLETIEIKNELLYYIPNSFTPNGDELNNTFKPVFFSGYDPAEYHLFIFNRWGELLYESYDSKIGWDGTFKNQGLVQNGDYVWKIVFKIEGVSERKEIVGSVNVIK
jgi:gliding motility-associated-like protein